MYVSLLVNNAIAYSIMLQSQAKFIVYGCVSDSSVTLPRETTNRTHSQTQALTE